MPSINNVLVLVVVLCIILDTILSNPMHALTLFYRTVKRRGRFLSAEDSSKGELEASSVCEDTVHEDFAVQSDGRGRLSSATLYVQRSHFYENFGDIDFWRKPSASHPTPYEFPACWTGLQPPLVNKKKERSSSDQADSSHQLMLSDATVDASQESLTFSHPVQPRARLISRQLSIPSRKIFRSADDSIASYYENAEKDNERISSSSGREGRRAEDAESYELPRAGVMYEKNYILMRSARCTSCPNLPDTDLEDGLYVIMDVAQARASAETGANVKYYNVPARIAGIPATYFMPGPLYNLPSCRLLPPRTVHS